MSEPTAEPGRQSAARRTPEEARAAYARLTLSSAGDGQAGGQLRVDTPGAARQGDAAEAVDRVMSVNRARTGRGGLLLTLLVALSVVVGASGLSDRGQGEALAAEISTGSGFVSASGTGFEVDGQPWSPVGFNDYRLTSQPDGHVCDPGYGSLSSEQLERRLDRVVASGGNVIRTWMFQSYWDPDRDGRGDFGAFDRLLAEAEARGLRVVGVLANHWGDCEGERAAKTIDFYAGGFNRPLEPNALSYLDYAKLVAARYADSPAIAFWELVNEAEAPAADGSCDPRAAAAALAGFGRRATGAIGAVDSNHLISFGTIGTGQCGTAGAAYREVSATVDICSIHLYDTDLTGTSPAEPLSSGPDGSEARLNDCGPAGVERPIVAGEIGFAPDLDPSGERTGRVTPETLTRRAQLLDARLEALREGGLAGFMVWQLEDAIPDPFAEDPFGIAPCDPVEGVVQAYGLPLDSGRSALARSLCPELEGPTLIDDSAPDDGSAVPIASVSPLTPGA